MLKKVLAFLGLGQIPKRIRTALEREGICAAEEGVSGWVQYTNFRGPGRYSGWRRKGIFAWYVLTEKRLRVYGAMGTVDLDLPFDHPSFDQIQFMKNSDTHFRFEFDATSLMPFCSGLITVQIRTNQAARIRETLERYAPNVSFVSSDSK